MSSWQTIDIKSLGTIVAAFSATEIDQMSIDLDVLEVLGGYDVFEVDQVNSVVTFRRPCKAICDKVSVPLNVRDAPIVG